MTDSATSVQTSDIHVVAVSGSLRRKSYTRHALAAALKGADELGATTQMIDLKEYDLPFVNPDLEETPDTERLRNELRKANGILLGTPEYHGSFSGVLKNALDLMGFDEFEGKIVGLVSVAAGRLGGVNSLSGLQTICRSLHAWSLPNMVAIPRVWQVINEDGEVNDAETLERLMTVGREVARFAFMHTSQDVLTFLREWEQAPYNPGGRW